MRRLQRIRLDYTKHILHHSIRLQLRTKSLVHLDQTVFIVNVETAQLGWFFCVTHVKYYASPRASRSILRKDVVILLEMGYRVARLNWRPSEGKLTPRTQVQDLHVRTQTVILRYISRCQLSLSRLLKHRSSSSGTALISCCPFNIICIFCRHSRYTNIILETSEIQLIGAQIEQDDSCPVRASDFRHFLQQFHLRSHERVYLDRSHVLLPF